MVRIVVTQEQARQLAGSLEPLEIIDEQGNRIGCFTQPFSAAEIAEAKRRSMTEKGGRTTAEVLKRLVNLENEP
jgi:hypothetical protein